MAYKKNHLSQHTTHIGSTCPFPQPIPSHCAEFLLLSVNLLSSFDHPMPSAAWQWSTLVAFSLPSSPSGFIQRTSAIPPTLSSSFTHINQLSGFDAFRSSTVPRVKLEHRTHQHTNTDAALVLDADCAHENIPNCSYSHVLYTCTSILGNITVMVIHHHWKIFLIFV